MSLHALDALDDALTATRRYRPRGLLEWVWVGVVVLVVASPGISVPAGGGSAGGGTGGPSPREQLGIEGMLPAIPSELLVVGLAVAAVLWVTVVVVGAFFEFPFLRWLRDGETAIGAEVSDHWRQALGLAAFRLVVNAVGFAILAAVLVTTVGTGAEPLQYVFALGRQQALVGLSSLLTAVVAAFTTAFVVPTMVLTDRGVLGGWRRFWSTLTAAPKQFLAYGVGVAVLAYIGGILLVLAVVVALIPVALVGGILALAVGGSAVVIPVAIVGGVLVTAVAVGTYALVQVFLRYYALLVLGDVDDELDLIPERRRELRSGTGDAADPGGGDDASYDPETAG